ncbi:MAG: CpaF family protein [Clostridia bacterium]|nr:CpaF family protein [Clostridia bacterium]
MNLDLLQKIRDEILASPDMDDDTAKLLIAQKVLEETDEIDIEATVEKYFLKVRRKLGVLDSLVKDDTISEIMVNGKDNIYIERKGKVIKTDLSFDSTQELEEVIRYIASKVHREINEMNPIVDARLEDGSRINGVYKNIAINGPILTIRKFNKEYITMEQMVNFGTLTRECMDYLKGEVKRGMNIFISGGTSSGKTTFLNALADFIPEDDRVVVIEDSVELKLDNIKNIVRMEVRNANSMGKGKVSMDQLIRTSLRMRPDRIIIGEVRGKEVTDMLQALNTGHSGSLSTGHGNSIRGMLRRLEAMYLMGSSIPISSIAGQITTGIDIFVHLKREGGQRKVVEIARVLGYQDGEYILEKIFERDEKGELVWIEKS